MLQVRSYSSFFFLLNIPLMLCSRVLGFFFLSDASMTRVFSKFSPYFFLKYSRRSSGEASFGMPDRFLPVYSFLGRSFRGRAAGAAAAAAPSAGFLPLLPRRHFFFGAALSSPAAGFSGAAASAGWGRRSRSGRAGLGLLQGPREFEARGCLLHSCP